MNERNPAPDPAKARWMAIQMVRWTGLGAFILGLLIYAGKIDLPEEAGWVLMAVGLLDALFMPSVLARMWKTPL
ncbi:MAG: hypothetical protein KDE25_16205 [Novosphingobium sp.]|nr:hypothetical protein [Novosphingobium sp.]